ncbi:MAG: NUDIX hydrolase [Lachnospiraceae bacterium]|nr:NUDIX hydrolase [Lachnospiraceae bacterium]
MTEVTKRLGRKLIHKGHILDLYQDEIELPDGKQEIFDFIGHKGAAAMVAELTPGQLLMVRQYRNALDRVTLEIPAGGLDYVGEPTKTCAMRELEEETGYRAAETDVEFLLRLKTTVAFCNENIDVYFAKNLEKTHQHLDEDEYVDVEVWDIEKLIEKIYTGEIQDSKTVGSLLAYYHKYYRA